MAIKFKKKKKRTFHVLLCIITEHIYIYNGLVQMAIIFFKKKTFHVLAIGISTEHIFGEEKKAMLTDMIIKKRYLKN
jgi:hypothetical protein